MRNDQISECDLWCDRVTENESMVNKLINRIGQLKMKRQGASEAYHVSSLAETFFHCAIQILMSFHTFQRDIA